MTEAPPTTTVTVSATIAAPPVRVWQVLTVETSSWWRIPYLAPGRAMHLDSVLGGEVWAAGPDGEHELHGTIRTFDAESTLTIGGVLLPGAYGGHITFTLTGSSFGTDITVEQSAVGTHDDDLESTLLLGWTELLTRLGELSEN